MNNIKWAFFGTSNFSVIVLDRMKESGYLPSLVVTAEDKPKGRKLVMTPPEVKIWAEKEKIAVLQLKSLKNDEIFTALKKNSIEGFDLFIVASYGKIIPQNVLDIPKYKTLNIHPSLLPKLRGPSPIQNAILSETETGISIMRLDKEMDHGPIVAQEKLLIENWPPYEEDLEKLLAEKGAELMMKVIPDWIGGKIIEKEQDHPQATYCKKILKTDGQINLEDDAEINLRKIKAYHVWPRAYFFDNKTRIIIKKAHIENGKLIIEKVLPEGKKEMTYNDYLNGKKN